MIKEIKDKNTLIALFGDLNDCKFGNNFLTLENLPMQIGVLRTNKGDGGVTKHIHKIRNIQIKSISNEFHMILRGKAIVTLYKSSKEIISKITLCKNMFCALYNGGHSFEFIKDDTLMIEVKCGSYSTINDDKEKF